MSDDKMTLCATQDAKFLELIDHVVKRTADVPKSSDDAIKSLVSLGEMCPKTALAIKMMSPPLTMLTKRQSDIFEFFTFILDYATVAESRRKDPLQLTSDLHVKAVSAREKFISSPAS